MPYSEDGYLQKGCEDIEKEYFYLDSNAKIFEVIKDLYTKPCDWQFVPTVKFTLNDIGIEMLHHVNYQLILNKSIFFIFFYHSLI